MKGLLIGAALLRLLHAELHVPLRQPGSARAVAAIAHPARAHPARQVGGPAYGFEEDEEDEDEDISPTDAGGLADFDSGPGYIDDNDDPEWYGGAGVPSNDTNGYPIVDCFKCSWDDYGEYPIMKKKRRRPSSPSYPVPTPDYNDYPEADPYGEDKGGYQGPGIGRLARHVHRRQLSGFDYPDSTGDKYGADEPEYGDYPAGDDWYDDLYPTTTKTASATSLPTRLPPCPSTCTRPTNSTTSGSSTAEPTAPTSSDEYMDYPVSTTFVTETSTEVVIETVSGYPTGTPTSSTELPNQPTPPGYPDGSNPGGENVETLANMCPAQCNPEAGKNNCGPSAVCVTATGIYPSAYYCMCQSGYRSSYNPRDFARQFRTTNVNTQAFVMVAPGVACDTPCTDQPMCTEAIVRDQCLAP